MNFFKGVESPGTIYIEKGFCAASATAVFLGVAASFFSVKCGVLDELAVADNCFAILLTVISLLTLMAVCGLGVLGVPIVLVLDCAFGAASAMLAHAALAASSIVSYWLVWSTLLYLLTATALIISSVSCGLSRRLLARSWSDRKLKRRIAASLLISFSLILVIVSVLILVFRFNSEIYI